MLRKLATTICLTVLVASPFVGTAAAGEFEIDGAHSSIDFSVRHFGVSNVKGGFAEFSGKIVFDKENLSKCSAHVTIVAASIDTRNEKRDGHLKSGDFLHVEEHPEITFEAMGFKAKGDGYVAKGKLTIRGITKNVEMPIEIAGPIKDPFGMTRLGIVGNLTIDRREYDLTWNKAMEAGGFFVGNDIKIEFSAEAVHE